MNKPVLYKVTFTSEIGELHSANVISKNGIDAASTARNVMKRIYGKIEVRSAKRVPDEKSECD